MNSDQTSVNGETATPSQTNEPGGAPAANSSSSAAESSSNGDAQKETQDRVNNYQELETLQAQAKEYLEGWQRARAEFTNYKKRIERDMKDTYQNASGDALKNVLPIMDDFDRALMNIPQDIEAHPWVTGVSQIQRKFVKLFEDFGVVQFDPLGQPFDPNQHQAIGTDELDDVPSGQITKTEQKGYAMGETILRPALVRVNR